MIATSDLIDALAADVRPIRRLRPPVARAACWLLIAAFVLVALTIAQGLRPDFVQRLQDATFDISVAGALLTGTLAAIAAFLLGLPDRSRTWLLLPMPALAVWLSTIGYQCLTNWISIDPAGLRLGETARCFATLVLTSLPLSLAMLLMLRHTAPLRPTAAVMAGSLAVAAITATALSLFHDIDASIMILAWNLGTAAVFVGFAGAFKGRIVTWISPRSGLVGE